MKTFTFFLLVIIFFKNDMMAQVQPVLLADNVNRPNLMVIDNNSMYVGDNYNQKIIKININNPTSAPVDLIEGLMGGPYGLTLKDEYLYISELEGGRILRVNLTNPNPVPETIISNLEGPSGLNFIGNNLYIALLSGNKICKIDISQPNPVLEDVIAVESPFDIEKVDKYIYYTQRIASGTVSRFEINNPLATNETIISDISFPSGLILKNNDLYFCRSKGLTVGSDDSGVVKFDINNPVTSEVILPGSIDGPTGLFFLNNDLFISDFYENKIYKAEVFILGTKEIQNGKIQFYPNPAKDFIRINGLGTQKNYKIFDLTGKLIQTGNISRSENTIYVNGMTKGLYFLLLEDGNKFKFMID
ncbi:T9SS type A sorting domain-containing protein [Chryseobacterium sp. Tr-659]|uniref:T9SS type A sorting domain-containing protein n=1 Tax=Chryseobacterium sp. Tr-659 TaxID=2608340 RepID=UPI001422B1B9|nr:T9SS type A sorting domain-containing protein [Chryseobacterium sp. Tr-659]NIF06697.1 T9SS type A sorting domain-containing protein [Chryseobacterium sp. Tr-659]